MSHDMIAERIHIAGQQNHDGLFPVAYQPSHGTVSLEQTQQWIEDQSSKLIAEASRHGAVLLRGFAVRSAEDFDAVISAFGLDSFTYEESLSNAVRVNLTPRVFTANEAPPDVSIFLHHEMAQTPLFPSRLFFCCETAPSSGGETPLCRSDILLERLQEARPEFVEQCERLGVRYVNVMPPHDDAASGQGRSWRSTLNAADQAAAERRLHQLGYDAQWIDDGSLRATTPVLPAVRSLVDGRRVFFNQLIAAFRGWKDARNDPQKSICFGDGSVIGTQDMDTAIRLADELSFDLAWQAGDVALIDNFLVMHGRRPFQGKRRVFASLVADDGERLAKAS
ncbi:MAG: TauD/TfdA family dioxygenase [Pseudomonadota bacterium]